MTGLRVGVAGLGRMGGPMAHNLAAAGLLAGVYNRTRARAAEAARELGVRHCRTPAELAERCDVLVTMVADDDASADLYTGRDGLVDGLTPGTVALEMSTVGIDHLRSIDAAVRERGGVLLDAPVSGSVALCETGTLTIMVGGEEADLERVRPVLEALGSRIFHLGPLGSGATMKFAVNTVVYGLNEALSEALVLAERAGLTREAAYEVFASSAVAAPFVHYRQSAFLEPETTPVAFRLELAAKDLALILGLAAEIGHAMPQAELNARVLDDAAAAGLNALDVSAVAEYLRRHAKPNGGPPW
jgi:3-hydroxyisobutyrate dehydrogenase-like beta-hydroxyacid dehydrogenase